MRCVSSCSFASQYLEQQRRRVLEEKHVEANEARKAKVEEKEKKAMVRCCTPLCLLLSASRSLWLCLLGERAARV